MYKKILAAVNEFTNSEMAARYALALANACNANITLVFVYEKGITKASFKRAEDALGRLFLEGKESGVAIESITEKGMPFDVIRDIVKAKDIDIVFASTRREDVEKRFFVRTIARDFMLHLPCSVAVVRVVHMGKAHPKDILVPLRGGMGHMEERAYFVSKLAYGFDSKVIVLHSPRPITGFFKGEVHLRPIEWEEHIPKEIEHFIEYLRRRRISLEKRIRPGFAGDAITIEAASRRNDLIVIGASERSLLNSILRGNPMEKVLRETPCNLIIFRPKRILN